jgi:myosin-1
MKVRLPLTARREEPLLTLKQNRAPSPELEVVRREFDKQPTRVRAVRRISNPGRVTATTAPALVPPRVPKETRSSQRTRSISETAKMKESGQPLLNHPPLRVFKSSSRLMQRAEPSAPQLVASRSSTAKSAPLLCALGSELPGTDPIATLARLITIRDNLTRALERKPSNSRRGTPPQLPFVLKWVDYSRKYGVRYILDDGSVGCVMTAIENFPVTVAFATNGVHHFK